MEVKFFGGHMDPKMLKGGQDLLDCDCGNGFVEETQLTSPAFPGTLPPYLTKRIATGRPPRRVRPAQR